MHESIRDYLRRVRREALRQRRIKEPPLPKCEVCCHSIAYLPMVKAYKGEEELYFDALVGYRGRFNAFGGLNYRLQLNVRNLLNEDDPVPVAAFVSGGIAKLATVEPRVIVVSFGVNF